MASDTVSSYDDLPDEVKEYGIEAKKVIRNARSSLRMTLQAHPDAEGIKKCVDDLDTLEREYDKIVETNPRAAHDHVAKGIQKNAIDALKSAAEYSREHGGKNLEFGFYLQ